MNYDSSHLDYQTALPSDSAGKELELIIKRNTIGGSGKFDAETAIPQLQALIADREAVANLEHLDTLQRVENVAEQLCDEDWQLLGSRKRRLETASKPVQAVGMSDGVWITIQTGCK